MQISPLHLEELLRKIDANVTDKIRDAKHIAVAGPSGSGKSTIIHKDLFSIVKVKPDIYSFSVSGMTRSLRGNERQGKDYFSFPSSEEFHKHEFLETNDYSGNQKLYGTLRSEIERITINERKRACFDVDINGALALKKIFRHSLFFVFLQTKIETLYERLLQRRIETGETEESIEKRILAAVKEKYRVKRGEVTPDYILEYEDSMRPGEAANAILFKSTFPFAVS